jgi:hypothetical protein
MDQLLRWFIRVDDGLRVSPSRRFMVGIPVAIVVYILGVKGLWPAVAVFVGVPILAMLLTVYARRRLGLPAPKDTN